MRANAVVQHSFRSCRDRPVAGFWRESAAVGFWAFVREETQNLKQLNPEAVQGMGTNPDNLQTVLIPAPDRPPGLSEEESKRHDIFVTTVLRTARTIAIHRSRLPKQIDEQIEGTPNVPLPY
jgi:hypothetical protein